MVDRDGALRPAKRRS